MHMCAHMLAFRRAFGNCMHRVHGHAIRLHEGLVPSLSLSLQHPELHTAGLSSLPVALPPLQPARDPQPARTVRLSLVDIPSRCVQLTRLIVLAAMSRPTSSPLSLCLSLCLCLYLLLLLASAAAACPVPPTDPLGPGSYGLFLTHDGLLRYTTRLPA